MSDFQKTKPWPKHKSRISWSKMSVVATKVRPRCQRRLQDFSDAEFASVGRNATVIIVPCLVIMYIMNYLDRQNIAAAKLADIDKDLRLSDVQYHTCISLLFVGYSKSASRWAAGSIFQLTSPNGPHAGSLQHHCRESQVPRRLHLRGYGCLGHDLRLHDRSPKLC